jgi:hypothetical protein
LPGGSIDVLHIVSDFRVLHPRGRPFFGRSNFWEAAEIQLQVGVAVEDTHTAFHMDNADILCHGKLEEKDRGAGGVRSGVFRRSDFLCVDKGLHRVLLVRGVVAFYCVPFLRWEGQ